MGADTKANAQELIREAGGLLERLQRGVALETLDESESSLGAEAVGRDTASTGAEAGAEACQGALTRKRTLLGGGAPQGGNLCLFEDGSERGGALVSDAVVPDTARDGWGHSERAGACQRR